MSSASDLMKAECVTCCKTVVGKLVQLVLYVNWYVVSEIFILKLAVSSLEHQVEDSYLLPLYMII